MHKTVNTVLVHLKSKVDLSFRSQTMIKMKTVILRRSRLHAVYYRMVLGDMKRRVLNYW